MRGQRRDPENAMMVVAKVKMVDVHKAVWDKNRMDWNPVYSVPGRYMR